MSVQNERKHDPLDAGGEALCKLIIAARGGDSIAALVDRALDALSYRNDEEIAAKILLSVLLHDDLAEALNGRL